MASQIKFAAISLSVLLAACHSQEKENKTHSDLIPVKVISLDSDTVAQQFTVSGQFTTEDETLLSFKTGGVIQRIYVKEGERVKRGQLLATLNLTEVNAGVEQSRIALQKAQRDYDRAVSLYKDSVATLEQMQNAQTALELARQQYTTVGFNQQHSEIRAAADGFVLRKFVNEGQVIAPGAPVLLVNGAGSAKWSLRAGISDRQWAAVKVGDKAVVTSDVTPGKTYPAKVGRKAEGVDMNNGIFVIHLELDEAPRDQLASGLFGKATVFPRQHQTAWSIPFDALLDGDAQEAYVFITNDGKTAKKVKVVVSKVDKNAVWVSSGLEDAKYLIISGSAYLADGSAIDIINDPTVAK